jgi:hypothetical protein
MLLQRLAKLLLKSGLKRVKKIRTERACAAELIYRSSEATTQSRHRRADGLARVENQPAPVCRVNAASRAILQGRPSRSRGGGDTRTSTSRDHASPRGTSNAGVRPSDSRLARLR